MTLLLMSSSLRMSTRSWRDVSLETARASPSPIAVSGPSDSLATLTCLSESIRCAWSKVIGLLLSGYEANVTSPTRSFSRPSISSTPRMKSATTAFTASSLVTFCPFRSKSSARMLPERSTTISIATASAWTRVCWSARRGLAMQMISDPTATVRRVGMIQLVRTTQFLGSLETREVVEHGIVALRRRIDHRHQSSGITRARRRNHAELLSKVNIRWSPPGVPRLAAACPRRSISPCGGHRAPRRPAARAVRISRGPRF